MGTRLGAILVAAALTAVPAAASAHPHVYAEALVVFVFSNQKLTEIRLAWNLDRHVSAELLHHYDKDRDGKLSPTESGALAAAAAPEIAGFVDFRVDGRRAALAPVRDFKVSTADGRIAYRFGLPLTAALDATRSKVSLGLYDPSYYVDLVLLAEGGVQVAGDAPSGCRHAVASDKSVALMGGTAFPTVVTLDCRRQNRK